MTYYKIDRNIIGKLTANEMHTYFCLLAKSDFHTGISHIKQDNLCKIAQIRKLETLQAHLNKFYKQKLVSKTEQGNFGEKGYFKTNTYYIPVPKKNWIRVNTNLIDKENISPKIKGFLLLMMCLTVNNTNFIGYNKAQIARILNIDTKTLRSCIKSAIENGWIKENGSGFAIIENSYFIDYKIPKDFSIERFRIHVHHYELVKSFCLSNGIIPPRYDRVWIDKLLCRWSEDFLTERLENFKDKIPKNRPFSLKYLAKTLGCDMTVPIKKVVPNIIID